MKTSWKFFHATAMGNARDTGNGGDSSPETQHRPLPKKGGAGTNNNGLKDREAGLPIRASFVVLGALLLDLAGCGLQQNAEDGQKDPKLGDYIVTIDPTSAAVTLTPELGVLGIQVRELKAVCLSAIPPDNCDSNDPGWDSSTQFKQYIKVIIDHSNLPSTTASIDFNVDLYLKDHPMAASSTSPEQIQVTFFPTHLPKDLTLNPRGGVTFRIDLKRPDAPAPQQEQTDKKPWMTATPSTTESFEGRASQTITVYYKGPRGKLKEATVTGAGGASFDVTVLGGLPAVLPGDGSGPGVQIVRTVPGFSSAKLILKGETFVGDQLVTVGTSINLTP